MKCTPSGIWGDPLLERGGLNDDFLGDDGPFPAVAVDRLKHRFFPTRATRSEDVRSAIEEMYRILDAPGSDAGMRPSRGRWGGYFFWTQVPSGSWIQSPGCAFSRSVSA